MRTTLNFDEDVLDQVRAVAQQSSQSLKVVINNAMRLGLNALKKENVSRPYQTKSHPMGLKSGYSLDHIQELLNQIEGEDSR